MKMKIAIVSPMDPRTGISGYSQGLASALSNLDEDVTIISPDSPSKSYGYDTILPEEYSAKDYDVTHFQIACSRLHEFQLHLVQSHYEEMKNTNIITTVHDARNFDAFNIKCLKCISLGLKSPISAFIRPYDIVDKGFQDISKQMIFHNTSALNEYKKRYKLDGNSLKCIPIPSYRLNYKLPENKIQKSNRMLVPGYISPLKGQDILLNAVKDLNMDFKLVFMGSITDENYGDYLNELVTENGLEDRVEFLGFVSDERFIEEMDRAQIILIPRLISPWLKKRPKYRIRKLFGLEHLINHSSSAVLTMAIASGKPIICSENSGFAEYVNDSNGMFCNTESSWRSAIIKMFENPEEVERMSYNSLKMAENELNPENIAIKHLNLYKTN